MENSSGRLSRREFLARFGKASAAAGVTLAAGKYFRNLNPLPRRQTAAMVRQFSVPDTAGVFAVARGTDRRRITSSAVEAAGGMGRFVSRGDKVLVKVNCAFARPAWMGATSSPEVTGEVVRLCYDAGASEVRVTDNPISAAAECFTRSGLADAVKSAGGRVLMPSDRQFARVKVNEGVIGTWEVLYGPLEWCDKLIGIPTVKTHNLCRVSLAMKNWYGLFGGSRARFHQDIHRVIAELAEFITPTLVVLDGTRKLITNGPTGGSASDVAPGNTVAVSTDQVAIDAFGAELLGVDCDDIEFIEIAKKRGLGISDYSKLPGFREVSF